MHRLPALALAAALLAAPAATAQDEPAQATISVVDQATGAPVRGARIDVPGVRWPTYTSSAGVARVVAPPGGRVVTVSRLGYAPARAAVEFVAGSEATRAIRLATASVAVDGVAASARRRHTGLDQRGFYDRQRRGFGAFMTGEEIDQIRPIRTLDLFRRMRGFRVVYTPGGQAYVTISRGTVGLRQCGSILLFVDGMLMSSLASPSEAMDMVPPENIAGIEGFAGPATIPAEYNFTGAACGVILIWTRMGA